MVVSLIVVATACASGAAPPAADAPDTSEPSTTAAAPTTSIATTAAPTTTVAPPLVSDGVARALVTTTDVVVPVLRTTNDGWVVRTPCRNEAHVLDGRPVEAVHVVLDPGHGGAEAGAVVGDLVEAAVNLSVAEIAAAELGSLGFEVVLTRYADVRVPIETRVEIADTLGADLLISIHHQGSGDLPTADTPGTEVYYQQGSSESKRFAGLLWEESVDSLGRFVDDAWFAGPDAGATYRPNSDTGEDFYGMVRRPETTSVLAEMSFMGNPVEAALLADEAFRSAEATAITNAVVRWYSTRDPGSGFVEPSFSLRSSGGGGGLGGCTDPDLGRVGDLDDSD